MPHNLGSDVNICVRLENEITLIIIACDQYDKHAQTNTFVKKYFYNSLPRCLSHI